MTTVNRVEKFKVRPAVRAAGRGPGVVGRGRGAVCGQTSPHSAFGALIVAKGVGVFLAFSTTA